MVYPLVTGYSFKSKWFSIMYSMDTARLAKGIPANLSRFTVYSDQCLLNTWLQSKTSLTLTVTEEYLELYCNNLLKSDTVTDCYYLGTHISNIKVKLSICRTWFKNFCVQSHTGRYVLHPSYFNRNHKIITRTVESNHH